MSVNKLILSMLFIPANLNAIGAGLHYLDLTRVKGFKFVSNGIFSGEVGRFPPICNSKGRGRVNSNLWYLNITL